MAMMRSAIAPPTIIRLRCSPGGTATGRSIGDALSIMTGWPWGNRGATNDVPQTQGVSGIDGCPTSVRSDSCPRTAVRLARLRGPPQVGVARRFAAHGHAERRIDAMHALLLDESVLVVGFV